MLESLPAPGDLAAVPPFDGHQTIVSGPPRAEQLRANLPAGDGSSATLVGVASPRLSWQYQSTDAGWRQESRELEVTRGDGSITSALVHDSAQVLVAWPFAALRSRERVSVRVRAAFGGNWTPWSDPAVIEAGLLLPEDWSASWITPATGAGVADAAPVIGTAFDVAPGLVSARL